MNIIRVMKLIPHLFAILILVFASDAYPNSDEYIQSIMMGISNRGENKDKPYVTAGDRAYIIGTQDGNFPDMGHHVAGEMAGFWIHPIKLMDGFTAKLSDPETGEQVQLSDASEFINYPYGNRLKYAAVLNGITTDRFQFCPDGIPGMVIQFTFNNTGSRKRELNFGFTSKTDLSPVWLSDQLGIKDSPDNIAWNSINHTFFATDNTNPWFAVWGSPGSSAVHSIGKGASSDNKKEQGMEATAEYSVSIGKNSSSTLTIVVAGSAKDRDDAAQTYEHLAKNHETLLSKKKERYVSIINRARVTIPDRLLQDVYHWVKINNDWLIRDVPEIGRGLGAGLMEYPWWFGCDNTYALQAVMATGDFNLAKNTLRLLKNESMKKNGNGRIVHEISTNGVVYNPGNTQETAHFIMCVERLFRWTGDLDFIREMYPVMKMGIQWLLGEMDQNRNLFPEGYGIMEVYGLNAELIDVSVYTQQALSATARIAGILNEPEIQAKYERLASELKDKINKNFWDDSEESYTDFYGNTAQAIRAADGAITQINRNSENWPGEKDEKLIAYYQQLKKKFSGMPEVNKGWITNKNWVINTPMETGIAPKEKAIPLLDKIRNENVGEYGPYLAAVEKNAMMTISTGVQAVAEYQYGRTDESLWYVNKIAQTFNRVLPGSISEMMPDYGQFTQAWTSYGIMLPVIQHIFGIQPDAHTRQIQIEPHLPSGWENISIENLPVGSNIISFSRFKSTKGIEYKLKAKEPGWNIVLKLRETPGAKYILNGKTLSLDPSGIPMTASQNHLLVTQ